MDAGPVLHSKPTIRIWKISFGMTTLTVNPEANHMERTFWKEGVVYQIYPRSFMDSGGDGIGDLKGILSKLDYLKYLGVDIVWLSPVYKSPNDDNGYDISDYCAIMDEFGTMADWEALLEGLHIRGMRLIMDLVVNHSSDEHEWFVESRSSKENNPYRDYYIWRPGKPDGTEPNNWLSFFGGSAWAYDEGTGEYYLHLFTKKQPDLNWENPKLREEVYGMMSFWLEKGIDGFRMDVINCISKTEGLPDAGTARYAWGGEHFLNGPRIHEYLQEMNRSVLAGRDIMTVGEMPGVTPEEAVLYTDPERREVHMVFQFETMDIDTAPGGSGKWSLKPWELRDLKAVTTKWQTELHGKGWNSLYLNNHDQPRMVSRFGSDGALRKVSAKLLATFLHTLQGTPYIYQGEELGMTNVRFPSIQEYKDVETLNFYREAVNEWGWTPEQAMASIYAKSRDNARTPMQWDDSANAGFTTGTPWIGIHPNYTEINAKEAMADPDSVFHYYRRLIGLRREHPIMAYGEYRLLLEDHPQIYAYTRQLESEQWLVILNFSEGEARFESPEELKGAEGQLIIANYPADPGMPASGITLRPYEARVYRLKG